CADLVARSDERVVADLGRRICIDADIEEHGRVTENWRADAASGQPGRFGRDYCDYGWATFRFGFIEFRDFVYRQRRYSRDGVVGVSQNSASFSEYNNPAEFERSPY